MGQITNPIVKGITVNPIDRQSGPGAGGGATGNNVILLGATAGTNEAISNTIIIGNGTGSGGLVDTANLNGSTIVGVGSATKITTGVGGGFPLTLFGSNDLTGFINTGVDSTVIVGSSIVDGLSNAALTGTVFIGNNLFPTAFIGSSFNNSVVIGQNISTGAAFPNASVAQSTVMIGANLFSNSLFAGAYVNSVFIGANIQFLGGNVGVSNTANIVIGQGITVPSGNSNISIGHGGYFNTGGAFGAFSNVCIGDGALYSGSDSVVIGAGAANPQVASDGNFGCVIIGANAGSTIVGSGLTNVFLIEASTTSGGGGATPSALLYGSFLNGNLILGNSTVAGANRDFGGVAGTNIVKLLNGTRSTGTAISGGGYFYVTGGFLHWVSSGGVDTQLSQTAAGQLVSNALTAFTNNAAAAAGTLLNAPVAGNPTKWIPVNDAGTIRNIPAW